MSVEQQHSSEPQFYIALVLKGTEEQYRNVLKYFNRSNGAKVIYQCKSLTYLHVARDDLVKSNALSPEILVQTSQSRLDKRQILIESIRKRDNSFFVQKTP